MEVCAAKPERAHPGPARSVRVGMKPGLSLRAKPERAFAQVELGVRRLDSDRGRQDLDDRATTMR